MAWPEPWPLILARSELPAIVSRRPFLRTSLERFESCGTGDIRSRNGARSVGGSCELAGPAYCWPADAAATSPGNAGGGRRQLCRRLDSQTACGRFHLCHYFGVFGEAVLQCALYRLKSTAWRSRSYSGTNSTILRRPMSIILCATAYDHRRSSGFVMAL